MKMHLSNVLNALNASDSQKEAAKTFFQNRSVSFSEVEKYLEENE
jgi:hydroxymethylglutaryl-CoA reductase